LKKADTENDYLIYQERRFLPIGKIVGTITNGKIEFVIDEDEKDRYMKKLEQDYIFNYESKKFVLKGD